jgi:hypothetical protein
MRILPVMIVVWSVALASATAATAGPTTRFGLSFGLGEENAPDQFPIGPVVGLGTRVGPVLAEVDYAYLIIAPDTASGSMHRLGFNVRADLYRDTDRPCTLVFGCTRAMSVYGEAGVAMRYVSWDMGYGVVDRYRQREAHLGVGIELDNQIAPKRYGWQFGVRIAFAPSVAVGGCRSEAPCTLARTSEPQPATGSSIDMSMLVESSFLIGH